MAQVSNSNLLQIDAGILPKNACIVIVRTEWNADIVDELENGCKRILQEHAIKNIVVVTVPGAFEISFAIKKYWDLNQDTANRPFAFIALGCVLRGGTPHFEYVCKGVTDGIVKLNLLLPVPTIFGILTVDDPKQARDRVGGSHGHKGEEAAITAIKMIALEHSLKHK